MTDIDNKQDVIDSRDVIDRIDELSAAVEGECASCRQGVPLSQDRCECISPEDYAELRSLRLLDDFCKGLAEDWGRPGVVLVRNTYFHDYARVYARELFPKFDEWATWPFNSINWIAAGSRLAALCYAPVHFDGALYWVRTP